MSKILTKCVDCFRYGPYQTDDDNYKCLVHYNGFETDIYSNIFVSKNPTNNLCSFCKDNFDAKELDCGHNLCDRCLVYFNYTDCPFCDNQTQSLDKPDQEILTEIVNYMLVKNNIVQDLGNLSTYQLLNYIKQLNVIKDDHYYDYIPAKENKQYFKSSLPPEPSPSKLFLPLSPIKLSPKPSPSKLQLSPSKLSPSKLFLPLSPSRLPLPEVSLPLSPSKLFLPLSPSQLPLPEVSLPLSPSQLPLPEVSLPLSPSQLPLPEVSLPLARSSSSSQLSLPLSPVKLSPKTTPTLFSIGFIPKVEPSLPIFKFKANKTKKSDKPKYSKISKTSQQLSSPSPPRMVISQERPELPTKFTQMTGM